MKNRIIAWYFIFACLSFSSFSQAADNQNHFLTYENEVNQELKESRQIFLQKLSELYAGNKNELTSTNTKGAFAVAVIASLEILGLDFQELRTRNEKLLKKIGDNNASYTIKRTFGLKLKRSFYSSDIETNTNYILYKAFATAKNYTYDRAGLFNDWVAWNNLKKKYFGYFFARNDEESIFVYAILQFYDGFFTAELGQYKKLFPIWAVEQIYELEMYAEEVRAGRRLEEAEVVMFLGTKSSNPEVKSVALLLCAELVKHQRVLDLAKQSALSELENREATVVTLAALILLQAVNNEISQKNII